MGITFNVRRILTLIGMKNFIAFIRKAWAWFVKSVTSKTFILAFPFAVFWGGAMFAQSFLLLIAGLIWVCPLILGIREDE